jgi:RimJ/RimL family protein N-acetyltransferase
VCRRVAAQPGVGRVTAIAYPDNTPALHVLEKLEFTPQGETTFETRRYAFFARHR